MSARSLHTLRDEAGASAVEFAIVAPAFFMLLLGVYAVGWSVHKISSVRYALEESGRALLVSPSMSTDDFDSLVKSKLSETADPNVTTSLTFDPAVDGIVMAHATASYNFTISIPMMTDQDFAYEASITVPLKE